MFQGYHVLLSVLSVVVVATQKCDHRPAMVRPGVEPLYNDMFEISVESPGREFDGLYQSDQKFVVTIRTRNSSHTFRWFMISVEDPEIDKSSYSFQEQPADVGRLKTLDGDRTTKYAETCHNTVENVDNTDKETVSVHWLSPKSTFPAQRVRIRAMVAKNAEAWYVEPDLSVELKKDNKKAIDSPPLNATEECDLCSEARYEVIFRGQWSRLTHPQKFPSNTDNNAYSYMVGASHDYSFTLWEDGVEASPGLRRAAETADTTELEQEVLDAVGFGKTSTRTLIRGRRNAHRDMFNPSHALFRVDQKHHLFSVFIAIQPSPDWFLGAKKFNLCSKDGWLEKYELPLYPWDAGTMDGVSYTSETKMTSPIDPVARVALGSFDRDSPFYQLNLNDLNPFGHLNIRLLDVYPVKDCPKEGEEEVNNLELPGSLADKEDEEQDCYPYSLSVTKVAVADEGQKGNQSETCRAVPDKFTEGPQISESRADCGFTEWESWSPCVPDGHCGSGNQFRTRYRMNWNHDLNQEEKCIADLDKKDKKYRECYVDCY